MANYKLTYFDMDGGRAEPVRIAFHAAGVKFTDERISFPQFAQTRQSLRFTCLPVLEVDGTAVTQSNAMARYAGKKAGLYPDDDLQALYCDEAMGAIEDLLHSMAQSFGLEGDELKAARETLVDGWLTVFLKGLNEMLDRGGDYFADDRLTIADLKVFGITRWLLSGQLDHVPTDLVARFAPKLIPHEQRTSNDPVVVAYYESRNA